MDSPFLTASISPCRQFGTPAGAGSRAPVSPVQLERRIPVPESPVSSRHPASRRCRRQDRQSADYSRRHSTRAGCHHEHYRLPVFPAQAARLVIRVADGRVAPASSGSAVRGGHACGGLCVVAAALRTDLYATAQTGTRSLAAIGCGRRRCIHPSVQRHGCSRTCCTGKAMKRWRWRCEAVFTYRIAAGQWLADCWRRTMSLLDRAEWCSE